MAVFGLTLVLLNGVSFLGMQTVDSRKWSGLQLNLILALAGIVLSLPIGILLALGRRSRLPVVKALCVVFIEAFRGVPLITLLFNAGVVITMFSSAYMAENIRGGLRALHPGQAEAARALGLASWQTTLFISLPQAIRNMIPAIVGQFISLFKDTSLVYIIGMLDIVNISRKVGEGQVEIQGFAHEIFVFIAIVFWIFTYTMSCVSRRIERNLGVGRRQEIEGKGWCGGRRGPEGFARRKLVGHASISGDGSPTRPTLSTFAWAWFNLPQPVSGRNPSESIRQQRLDSNEFTSRAELARRLGVTRAHVTQVLSLLHLAPDVESLILSRGDPIGEKGLGIRTLRSLLHLPVDKQINWIKESRTGGLERQDC